MAEHVQKMEISAPEPDTSDNTFLIGYDVSVDLNDIKEMFMMLTDDQRNIVMHIYYLYKNNKKYIRQNNLGEECVEKPKIFLHGPAGTGKSTVINFIEKLITWEENKTSDSPHKLKVFKCAFTVEAASNIKGVTLNRMFSIPYYNTRSPKDKSLDSIKETLKDAIFFICDEISIVGEVLMMTVNKRLQKIFENEKVYANTIVLLVGDLYQICPIKQKALYDPKSELWACCELYELTKILRQQDEKFVKALNNFRHSNMTEEDEDLLKSREIQDIDQVPDLVIHLFYINKDVKAYNDEKINKSNEKEEVINAVQDRDKWRLTDLRVKIGLRYMITQDIDVGDGLAMGTTGIVKDFEYDKDGSVVAVWMDFRSNVIGKKLRSKCSDKYSKPDFQNWVPIQRSEFTKTKDNSKKSKHNNKKPTVYMFPLTAAEAVTVCKCLGLTFDDGVCIRITDHPCDKFRTDKSLQYVALTRVKRLQDLYIHGPLNFSIPENDKIKGIENELIRLRTERKLKFAYETFEDKTGDVIIYLNTALTFNEYYQFIGTDKWYRNGSLLIFTETNTIESDKPEIPNFEIAYRSDYNTGLRSGGGIICYKEGSKSLEYISSIADNENKIHLTLFLYEKFLYILTGVQGNFSDDHFKAAINEFVPHIRGERCVMFIGNLNKDANLSYLTGLDFKKLLSCDTNEGGQCDMVFTLNCNIQEGYYGFYEYIPSFHKPLYVKLPPNESPEILSLGPVNEATKRPVVGKDSLGEPNALKRQKHSAYHDATGIKMAIIADDISIKLTQETTSLVRMAIFEMMEKTPDPIPDVIVEALIAGALHVLCANESAASWLCGLNGKTVADIKLKVVNVKDLPKPVKMAWKIENIYCLDVSRVLALLQRVNPGLRTSEWRVIDSQVEKDHVRRIVLMDQDSASYIKSRGYCLQSGPERSYFESMCGDSPMSDNSVE